MKLYGQEVPQSVVDAANAAMIGRFTDGGVVTAMNRASPGWYRYDCARRLLQRARKAGKIRYEGGYWHEVVR